MSKIFISYSRKDKDFVKKLYEALTKSLPNSDQDVWVDWEDIPPNADWREEIRKGVIGFDIFLFVISPDSVASAECKVELDHAIENNKRLMPIVCRDVEYKSVHPSLGALNWIFFRENDDFDSSLQKLLEAINTDLPYLEVHTRLLKRALEWDSKKRDKSFLLRGNDLKEAREWYEKAVNKQPLPTTLQTQYIINSSKYEHKKQSAIIAVSGFGLILTTILALISFKNFKEAQEKQIEALAALSEAKFANNDQLGAMIVSVEASKLLQKVNWIPEEHLLRTLASVEKVVYGTREKNRLEGHQQNVWSVAFSPDGKTIATASGDHTVKLWNLNGKEVKTLTGHTDSVLSVAFSSKGEIVTASADGTAKIWDINGKYITTLRRQSKAVNQASFSPDGELIVTASSDNSVIIWNRQGKFIKNLVGHTKSVNDVTFSPDGQKIASVGDDRTIKLWQRSGELIKSFPAHQGPINSVSFSPDGKKIASASNDKTVRLWNLEGKEVDIIQGYNAEVQSVHFSTQGDRIATGSSNNTVQIWTKDGHLIETLTGHTDSVNSVNFSPKDDRIASASADGTVKVWNLKQTENIKLSGHSNTINAISFSRDGKVVTASSDETLRLWDIHGNLLAILRGHKDRVLSVDFSPKGDKIISGSEDGTIKIWKSDRWGKFKSGESGTDLQQPLKSEISAITSLKFSPDGKNFVSASNNGTIVFWNSDGKWLSYKKQAHKAGIATITFSPDAKTIASAANDKNIKLWSLGEQRNKLIQVKTLTGHSLGVKGVTFSPDGNLIVSVSSDKTIRIWNVKGEIINNKTPSFEVQDAPLFSVSFSPNGQIFATADRDGDIMLWKRDGILQNIFKWHNGASRSVSFSSDAKMLASAGADNTAILGKIPPKESTNSKISRLLKDSCNWLGDYLENNPNLTKEDQSVCDGVNN